MDEREVIFLKRSILVFGIIFLIIVSAVSPIVFGYNIKTSNEQKIQSIVRYEGLMEHRSHYDEYIFYKMLCIDGNVEITEGNLVKNGGGAENNFYIFKEMRTQNIRIESKKWIRTFGGPGWDHGESVQHTTDEGYIIVGDTESDDEGGLEDVLLIKTDSYGNEVWIKTFGEPGIQRDLGLSVIQTNDGGYILTGWKGAFGTTWFDLWVIKTDSNGDIIWDRVFIEDDFEWGKCIQQTTDGGFIIVGTIMAANNGEGDVWLIKIDANGYKVWDKTFGGDWVDWGESVQQTSDGGYIITARTHSFGNGGYDVWLIKTDAEGNMTWNQTFGGLNDDLGKSVQQTTDSQYIIAGITESFAAGEKDAWLIKTNENGEELWNRTFGGKYSDSGESVQQTSDGGYIITGETWSFGNGSGDVWLIKTDEDGLVSNSPDAPTITGLTRGKAGEEYTYNSSTTDPDEDDLYYLFDWGDNTNTGWVGPYPSGFTASESHIWNAQGVYRIRVKAKDSYGVESDWSEPLLVTMPRNRVINIPFFNFLQGHPNLVLILRHLLQRLGLQ